MTHVDTLVIGAGAAGLFCAGLLGQRGQSVLLVDHAKTLGEKIRISGGGRCNFTNRDSSPQNFLSLNPSFAKSALARYRPADFIHLVRSHRIGFHEKHRGQLFCDDSATQIVAMLMAECDQGGVQIRHPVSVHGLSRDAAAWQAATSMGAVRAQRIVIATGGLPVPAIGATAIALEWARQFGLAVTEVRPGLVPLSFTDERLAGLSDLSGVSLPVRISSGARDQRYGFAVFDEDLLITHKGLSGPAVLQASSYWQEGESIAVQWLADSAVRALAAEEGAGGKSVESVLAAHLPERFARWVAHNHAVSGRRWAEIRRTDRMRLMESLRDWSVKPAGTLGWKKAEVMVGGVDTRELDGRSMMAKSQPGLYFIGECVDVTGHLGGHNFQWAWASAYACALSITADH